MIVTGGLDIFIYDIWWLDEDKRPVDETVDQSNEFISTQKYKSFLLPIVSVEWTD